MIQTVETSRRGAWTRNLELPMDGRLIEIEDYSGARYQAFYNYLTDKWRSYPDGFLLADLDAVLFIAQWRKTGLSVLCGE